jgi:hypothetical protein
LSLAFSPDETVVAMGFSDTTVQVLVATLATFDLERVADYTYMHVDDL